MKIYLDDLRPIPPGWVGVRTPEEFKEIIENSRKNGEIIEELSFDNDLGVAIEGYDLAKWLRDNHPLVILEAECSVHSANPSAMKNIEVLINNIKSHPDEVREMAREIEKERQAGQEYRPFSDPR